MTGEPPEPSMVLAGVSPAARRMWILEQLDPGPGLHVQTSLRIGGPLERAAVRDALDALARRHQAVRTRFPTSGRVVRPVVDDAIELPLAAVTASDDGRDPGDPEEALRALAIAQSRRSFDLDRGPLARALLVQLGPDEHHLMLLCHHTVVDRWAASELARDLIGLLCGPDAAVVPPPSPSAPRSGPIEPTRTGDGLAASDRARLIRYWSDRLAGGPVSLDLPTDRARPARCRHIGAFSHATLDPAPFEALSRLAREAGTTRFTAVLAAWTVVLHRLTAVDDLVVGTHLAMHEPSGHPRPIGCDMNTVPLRVDVGGDPSFRRLLSRARDTVDGALTHAELPFDVLVEHVGVGRDAESVLPGRLLVLGHAGAPRLGRSAGRQEHAPRPRHLPVGAGSGGQPDRNRGVGPPGGRGRGSLRPGHRSFSGPSGPRRARSRGGRTRPPAERAVGGRPRPGSDGREPGGLAGGRPRRPVRRRRVRAARSGPPGSPAPCCDRPRRHPPRDHAPRRRAPVG